MSKYDQYPLYNEMHKNYNKREQAVNLVRISCMAYSCEEYAKAHPDSPFFAELMALAALYDDCEGSPFWEEHFEGKFSSPNEAIASAKGKFDDWIESHDSDAEVRCIRAALTLLTGNPYDPVTIHEVGQDLYKVMVSNNQVNEMLWCSVAWGADFGSYLDKLEKNQTSPHVPSSGRNYIRVEKEEFKDENTYIVAKRLSVSENAAIIYSYTVSAEQILEALVRSPDYESGMTIQQRYNLSVAADGSILAHGVYLGVICSLVEAPEDGFSAVVVSCFLNTASYNINEEDAIREIAIRFMLGYDSVLGANIIKSECNVEKYDLRDGLYGGGFAMSSAELADAFRSSRELKPPYVSMVDRSAISPPLWYVQKKSEASRRSGGCYVATAVYGSYDCPEVWVLRRFRDHSLAKSMSGRLFIKLYYTASPTLVKLFGDKVWFRQFWKGKLDKIVRALRKKGYKDTPYKD